MDLKTIGAIAAFLLGSSGLVWKLNDNVKINERVRADAEILNITSLVNKTKTTQWKHKP